MGLLSVRGLCFNLKVPGRRSLFAVGWKPCRFNIYKTHRQAFSFKKRTRCELVDQLTFLLHLCDTVLGKYGINLHTNRKLKCGCSCPTENILSFPSRGLCWVLAWGLCRLELPLLKCYKTAILFFSFCPSMHFI